MALLSVLVSGAVLLAFGTTAGYLIYRERLEALDREIRSLVYRHPGWMGARADFERLSTMLELVYGEDRREQIILMVADTAGVIRHRSPHWPEDLNPESLDLHLSDSPKVDTPPGDPSGRRAPAPRRGPRWAGELDAPRGFPAGIGRGRGPGAPPIAYSKSPRFLTVDLAAGSWRLGVFGHEEDRLVVGLDCAGFQAELDRMRHAFLLALPVALLAVGGGGAWLARRALRPLSSIAQVAERVTARGLDQRIPPSDNDPEIRRLIRVLNDMMDRLEKSFHQATRFSADASHELKTPLAVMQGEIESALQTAEVGSRQQEVLAALLEETRRLAGILRSLLLLAQADAGRLPLAPARVDLSAELVSLREDIETLAAGLGLRVDFTVPPAVWIEADPILLRQALLNLLVNAVHYAEPGGRVAVSLTVRAEKTDVEIANSGPGIAPEDQPRLFDRFFRAEAARARHTGGSGLGLSLAREIARAHQGDLVLAESRPGLTRFRLIWPRPGSGPEGRTPSRGAPQTRSSPQAHEDPAVPPGPPSGASLI